LGGQKDLLSNVGANANARTEAGNLQGPVSNGVAKTVVLPTAKTSQIVTPAPSNDLLPKVPFLPKNGDTKPKNEKEM
jgi:hypothetical protein